MQCADSRLPSVDVPFSFLYFYILLCCILYADFHFPPSYCITYECLPFLPQSICVAFSPLPLISGINFPASKSKIKAFSWSQEPKMQLLHTSERKGREGRRESSGAGSHLLTPTTSSRVHMPSTQSLCNVLSVQRPNWSCGLLPHTGASIHPSTSPSSTCLSGQQSQSGHQTYTQVLYKELHTGNNLCSF